MWKMVTVFWPCAESGAQKRKAVSARRMDRGAGNEVGDIVLIEFIEEEYNAALGPMPLF